MTTGSLGLRSASYGSLQQHLQNTSPIQTTPPLASRKDSKMFKEKDNLFHWVFKFAPRKKVGMLLLCVVSIAAMLWVLYVGKGVRVTKQMNKSCLKRCSPNNARALKEDECDFELPPEIMALPQEWTY